MSGVPPWSAWIEVIRTDSRMPASAARVLQRMKFPTLTERTLTPLSLAPIRLPPVAMVWSPQRVRLSRIVITTITPIAQ